jgi:hypothetical protein
MGLKFYSKIIVEAFTSSPNYSSIPRLIEPSSMLIFNISLSYSLNLSKFILNPS